MCVECGGPCKATDPRILQFRVTRNSELGRVTFRVTRTSELRKEVSLDLILIASERHV